MQTGKFGKTGKFSSPTPLPFFSDFAASYKASAKVFNKKCCVGNIITIPPPWPWFWIRNKSALEGTPVLLTWETICIPECLGMREREMGKGGNFFCGGIQCLFLPLLVWAVAMALLTGAVVMAPCIPGGTEDPCWSDSKLHWPTFERTHTHTPKELAETCRVCDENAQGVWALGMQTESCVVFKLNESEVEASRYMVI